MTLELRAMPTAAQVDREMIRRRGLREFVRRAWPIIYTTPLRWNWHIDAICDHLEAVSRGEIAALVINQPPGTSKSSLVSILWPVWVWTIEPDKRFLCASHTSGLAEKFARISRTLIETTWFADRWPEVRFPTDKTASTAVSYYENTAKGWRLSVPVPSAKPTGEHPDIHAIDDPNNPEDVGVASKVALLATLSWWQNTMPTRFRDREHPVKVCTMQRLHEIDLSAEMTRDGATVLCLPMRYEPTHPHVFRGDPRTVPGELLDPGRLSEAGCIALEKTLRAAGTASQLQQRPVPEGGAIFKATYFTKAQSWIDLPNDGVGTWTQVWDCTFKGAATSDYVVGQVWYHAGPNHYCVEQVRGQWGLAETCKQVAALSERFPRATKKLVEGAANGFAVVEVMQTILPGFEIVKTDGGLESWANASEPLWSGGNVFLPDEVHANYAGPWTTVRRRGAPWLQTFVAEHLSFPRGANDDTVAASSQYLRRAGASRGDAFKKAMDASGIRVGANR